MRVNRKGLGLFAEGDTPYCGFPRKVLTSNASPLGSPVASSERCFTNPTDLRNELIGDSQCRVPRENKEKVNGKSGHGRIVGEDSYGV